jgi:hypothetical protein
MVKGILSRTVCMFLLFGILSTASKGINSVSVGTNFLECMVWERMSSSPHSSSKLTQLSTATYCMSLLVGQQHFCCWTMSNPSLPHWPLLQPQFPRLLHGLSRMTTKSLCLQLLLLSCLRNHLHWHPSSQDQNKVLGK